MLTRCRIVSKWSVQIVGIQTASKHSGQCRNKKIRRGWGEIHSLFNLNVYLWMSLNLTFSHSRALVEYTLNTPSLLQTLFFFCVCRGCCAYVIGFGMRMQKPQQTDFRTAKTGILSYFWHFEGGPPPFKMLFCWMMCTFFGLFTSNDANASWKIL